MCVDQVAESDVSRAGDQRRAIPRVVQAARVVGDAQVRVRGRRLDVAARQQQQQQSQQPPRSSSAGSSGSKGGRGKGGRGKNRLDMEGIHQGATACNRCKVTALSFSGLLAG